MRHKRAAALSTAIVFLGGAGLAICDDASAGISFGWNLNWMNEPFQRHYPWQDVGCVGSHVIVCVNAASHRSAVSRHRRRACPRRFVIAYRVHHPTRKPRALRTLSGCRLYRADYAFHSKMDRAGPKEFETMFLEDVSG